jgi:hypothetical protein
MKSEILSNISKDNYHIHYYTVATFVAEEIRKPIPNTFSHICVWFYSPFVGPWSRFLFLDLLQSR